MKKITLLLSLLFITSLASAQVLNEGFDTGVIPAGWANEYVSATVDWQFVAANQNTTVTPRTGAGMAAFWSNNYDGDRTRLVSPSLDLSTLPSQVLTFFYTQEDWGGDQDELRVYYKTSAAGAWVELAAFTADTNPVWTEVNLVLPNPSADYYIALDGTSGYGRGITVDDLLVDNAPSCLTPGSLSVFPTSPTATTLSWTPAGTETDFTYEYGITGFTLGTGTSGSVTGNSASISGLTAGTVYDFYVQANCGVDGDSGFAGPFSWTQPDTGESCGTATVATLETDCGVATPISLDFTGATSNLATSCDTYNNYGLWITVTTDIGGGLSVNASASVDMAIYEVCGGTDIACYETNIAPSVDVSLSPNTQYYLYFWQEGTTSTAMVDICISTPPTCFPIDGVPTIDLITDVLLDFSWNAPTGGTTPVGYNWEIVPDGNAPGVGTVASGSTGAGVTSASSGSVLVAATDYDLYITTDCGGGDTNQAGPFSFTTNSGPPPANDQCSGAITVTMETSIVDAASATILHSGTVTNGTITSVPAETCDGFTGNAADDMWYYFEALTTNVNITFEQTFDGVATLYSGTCGALVFIDCDDSGNPEEINAIGLTIGEFYYARIYNYGAATPTGDFDVKIWSPDTLSIDDVDGENAFTYYPNPTKNSLTLKAVNEIQNVSIYNMLGQEVLRTAPNAIEKDIDMSSLQTGTYFVQVTINDVTETVRIIKQ